MKVWQLEGMNSEPQRIFDGNILDLTKDLDIAEEIEESIFIKDLNILVSSFKDTFNIVVHYISEVVGNENNIITLDNIDDLDLDDLDLDNENSNTNYEEVKREKHSFESLYDALKDIKEKKFI